MINMIIFDNYYLGFIWLIVALIFLLAEISTPGLFLFIAFALGAGVASIFSFLGFSLLVQCLIFIFGFILAFLSLRKLVKVELKKRLDTNVDALKGKNAIVIKSIDKNRKGLVKIDGEVWTSIGLSGTSFHKGDLVKVVSVQGNRLIVK